MVVIGGGTRGPSTLDEDARRHLKRVGASAKPLIGIYTGSFLLVRTGLMSERRTCVSRHHYRDFAASFPGQEVVADRLFLIDGPRIACAGGAAPTAALATHLIEKHIGRVAAHRASRMMLFKGRQRADDTQPHPMASSLKETRLR